MSRGLDRETSFVPKSAFVLATYKNPTPYPLPSLSLLSYFSTMASSSNPNPHAIAFSTPGSDAPITAPIDASPSAYEVAETSTAFRDIYEQLAAAKSSVICASTGDARMSAIARFRQIIVSTNPFSSPTFLFNLPP
jgi:hypothetical protein